MTHHISAGPNGDVYVTRRAQDYVGVVLVDYDVGKVDVWFKPDEARTLACALNAVADAIDTQTLPRQADTEEESAV